MRQGEVVFALVSGAHGGGQRVAFAVARALKDQGHAIAAIAPDDGPLLEEFRTLGARTHITGPLRSYDVAMMFRLRRLLRGSAVVYTHTVPVHEAVVGTAALVAGCRLVVHRHIAGSFSPRRLIRGYQVWLWRAVLRRAGTIMGVAPHVADQVREHVNRTVDVVPNGVRMPPESSQEHDSVHVGYIGRLDPVKRVEDFLEAASVVRRSHRIDVVVLGGGLSASQYEQRLHDLAASAGLSQSIFRGARPSAETLRELDIVVLPSEIEGHPLIVLEAMAQGRVVVATDIPGTRDTIEDGVDGRLVPLGRPDEIARVLIELIDDPAARARIGAAARAKIAAHFTEEQMVARLIPLVLGS